jgi:hypothetical protein
MEEIIPIWEVTRIAVVMELFGMFGDDDPWHLRGRLSSVSDLQYRVENSQMPGGRVGVYPNRIEVTRTRQLTALGSLRLVIVSPALVGLPIERSENPTSRVERNVSPPYLAFDLLFLPKVLLRSK